MNQILNVDKDAFSSGQISSKIWLCEELEKLYDQIDNIWIYGGWYGITALLLRSRGNINIKSIRSFDLDPSCESVADAINENWKWKNWEFKSVTADCNTLKPIGVDLIINTSTEHFDNLNWWNNIPKGKTVALQGNNMKHEDHIIHFLNLKHFLKTFPMNEIFYQGQLDFKYPTWKFSRYMVIGKK